MTNKRTYNRIATVFVAIMLIIIAFAVPMRTASADEMASQNIFEGCTVDLVVENMSNVEEARHENLSPVFDTSDSNFYGIDLAATLDGIRSTYKWSVVTIYINFQTPIDFTGDDFFRYTATYQSSTTYFPIISYFVGDSLISRTFKYDPESDKYIIDGESVQISKIRLTLPSYAYETNLASIITPAPIKGEQGETPSAKKYGNLFEGCTVDLIAGSKRYENLTAVYDTADVQYQGIDLAATLNGLEVPDSSSTVEVYINFQTPVSLGADSFFRYTDMNEFDVGSVPHYYPTLRIIEESSSAHTINYDVESDMFKLGKDTQLSRIRLLFSATSYSEHLGSILAPAIAYEAPEDDGNQSNGNNSGDEKNEGGNQSGTTQPDGNNSGDGKNEGGNHGNEQLPSLQVDILSASVGGIIIVAFIIVLAFISKKHK